MDSWARRATVVSCSPAALRNYVTLHREDLSLATSFSEQMRPIRYFGSEEFYELFLHSCIVHSADGRAEPAAYRRATGGQSRQASGGRPQGVQGKHPG